MLDSLGKFNPENRKEDAFEKKEKPDFLYHGSPNPDIQELEPRKGHVPDDKDLERSFASDLPAFAAAHGFSWASKEGFNRRKKIK